MAIIKKRLFINVIFFLLVMGFFCSPFLVFAESGIYKIDCGQGTMLNPGLSDKNILQISSQGVIISQSNEFSSLRGIVTDLSNLVKDHPDKTSQEIISAMKTFSVTAFTLYFNESCSFTFNNSNVDTKIINETPATSSPIAFAPEIGIPGFSGKMEVNGFLFGNFLKALFTYLIYLSGVSAVIIFIIAGFQWVLAGGNQSKIGEAKKRITNSIIGLVLCVSSVLILGTINSDLINIIPIPIQTIIPVELRDDGVFQANIEELGAIELGGIDGVTFTKVSRNCGNCISCENFVGLSVPIYDQNGRGSRRGHRTQYLVVNKAVANEVARIFVAADKANVPIYEIGGLRNVDNCTNTTHGKGVGIDVNSSVNFYYRYGGSTNILNSSGQVVRQGYDFSGNYYKPSYSQYSSIWEIRSGSTVSGSDIYSLNPNGLVQLFKSQGWCWGGDWSGVKDYMHFSKPFRGKSEC